MTTYSSTYKKFFKKKSNKEKKASGTLLQIKMQTMAGELTDHQIKILKIVDHVRWGEEDDLDLYKYHLVRRAVGQKDVVIEFELQQAVDHAQAFQGQGFPTPPPGPERSPWIETWNVDLDRYRSISDHAVDLSQFEPGS